MCFWAQLGPPLPTKIKLQVSIFVFVFVPMGTTLWESFDFSFFILCLWVQLGKGILLPTIANKGGTSALLYLFCLLL
jgi:hypothetical protein